MKSVCFEGVDLFSLKKLKSGDAKFYFIQKLRCFPYLFQQTDHHRQSFVIDGQGFEKGIATLLLLHKSRLCVTKDCMADVHYPHQMSTSV